MCGGGLCQSHVWATRCWLTHSQIWLEVMELCDGSDAGLAAAGRHPVCPVLATLFHLPEAGFPQDATIAQDAEGRVS
jgi:hypothetical protein